MTVFNISLPCALPRPNRRSAFETPGSDAKGHSSEQPNLRAVATRSCNLSPDVLGEIARARRDGAQVGLLRRMPFRDACRGLKSAPAVWPRQCARQGNVDDGHV